MSEDQTKKLGLRHIGSQGRNPLVLLGYNPTRNEVMVIDMNFLRTEEITWLANFMSQEHVYSRSTLASSLADTVYSPGISAFINFAGRAQSLPLYEVRVSNLAQLKEWNGTDASYDPRIPPHPLVDKVKEARKGSGAGVAIPAELVPPPARTSEQGGDVMDTVRKFLEENGGGATFIAKPADGETKSVENTAPNDNTVSRLTALEDRLANIEKLLQPAKPVAKKPLRRSK